MPTCYNLGVILDVETKQMLRVAPIFNNGRSFYRDAKRSAQLLDSLFEYEARPFDSNPCAQLSFVRDISWLDTSKLNGFSATVKDIFKTNPEQRSWFAEAAARQFEIRLEYLMSK
ncbi:MAG: hypothetical protein IKE43_05460 [Coriobacteriales bacterium]|nr:hypothetical protein [Coriobacteriales bacterium]